MIHTVSKQIGEYDFEFKALMHARNYRHALVAEFQSFIEKKVIEIGSGVGQMTTEFSKIPGITQYQPVEPDSAFCSDFRRLFPGQSLIEGTIKDVKTTDWSAIISINVLEHIEDDRAELAAYHRLLKQEKGVITLFVPARPEIFAPIDGDFGHYRRYTKKEIQSKLTQAGFKIEKLRYYNFVGYFAWWLNFRIMKKRTFKDSEVKLFDRVIFPIVHFLESRICRPPFGQSLLVVARAK
jgi:SAM-dependent methyltransferase